jgi:hypothetical protein
MIPERVTSFARGAALAAVAAGTVLFLVTLSMGLGPGWGMSGWFVAATISVCGGASLAFCHGRPGAAFVAAMAATMASRLAALGVGVAFAAAGSGPGRLSYLGGFAAGFAPVMVWEVAWFFRAGRRSP